MNSGFSGHTYTYGVSVQYVIASFKGDYGILVFPFSTRHGAKEGGSMYMAHRV